MRVTGPGLAALGVAAFGVACARPFMGEKIDKSDKSMVTVELYCVDGAVDSYGVNPYTAKIPDRTKKFTWTLTNASNVVEAIIAPKNPDRWPFDDAAYRVTPGHPAKSKTPKFDIPEGKYSYSITAVCRNGEKLDTTSVDPDMIIPRETRPRDTQ